MCRLVQDLFGKGIHSACICPGFTDTPMLRHAIAGNARPDQAGPEQAEPPAQPAAAADEFFRNFVSLGRLLTSPEIARHAFLSVTSRSAHACCRRVAQPVFRAWLASLRTHNLHSTPARTPLTSTLTRLILFAVHNPSLNGSVLHANGGQKET